MKSFLLLGIVFGTFNTIFMANLSVSLNKPEGFFFSAFALVATTALIHEYKKRFNH